MKLESCTEKQNVNGTLNKAEEMETQKNRKKTRTVFSRHQIFYLESAFEAKRYLSSTERSEIASTLNLTETQVKVWFQNRRNKWKSQLASDPSISAERLPMLPYGGRFSFPLGTFGNPLYPPLFYLWTPNNVNFPVCITSDDFIVTHSVHLFFSIQCDVYSI